MKTSIAFAKYNDSCGNIFEEIRFFLTENKYENFFLFRNNRIIFTKNTSYFKYAPYSIKINLSYKKEN